jgi:hypothetical protein
LFLMQSVFGFQNDPEKCLHEDWLFPE